MSPHFGLTLLLAMSGVMASMGAVAVADGPEIFSLEPDAAPGGAEIVITGKGLRNTRQVLFVFDPPRQNYHWPYLVVRAAKYLVVSDRALKVATPERLTAGESATVVVITKEGATVGAPPSIAVVRDSQNRQFGKTPFYRVQDGGTLTAAQGHVIVESGGIVVKSSAPVLHFVKAGGTLLGVRSGIVYHEPGAVFGEKVKAGELLKIVEVPRINLSVGVEPFIFESAPGPPGAAASAPLITSISPDEAAPGSIVHIQGEGFTGALKVIFYQGGSQVKAGFRVLSDREMKVQVPDGPPFGKVLVAVVNPKGVTLTTPTDDAEAFGDAASLPMAPPQRPRRPGERRRQRYSAGRNERPLLVVGTGLLEQTPSDRVCYLLPGSVAVKGGSICFVKQGARVADLSQTTTVFYEPGAAISADARRADAFQLVSLIRPSPLQQAFVINPQMSADAETDAAESNEAPAANDQSASTNRQAARATMAPHIDSISPAKAAPGEPVVLRGKGFTGATDVFLLRPGGEPLPADFHVLSDERLQLSVPRAGSGQQLIVVVNSEGLALTAPRTRAGETQLVDHVVAGDSASWAGTPRLYIVEKGATISHVTSAFILFVKNGGAVGDRSGKGCIFHEPEAIIPESVRQNPNNAFLEVKTIAPSTGVKPFIVESR